MQLCKSNVRNSHEYVGLPIGASEIFKKSTFVIAITDLFFY